MERGALDSDSAGARLPFFLAYIADLELEVDRLRKQGQLIRHEAKEALRTVNEVCAQAESLGISVITSQIGAALGKVASILRDTHESGSQHPAYDQVAGIGLRSFVEQIFRWQQRLQGAPEVGLRLQLQSEQIEWFPARLRHILDNLISNALRFRDPKKTERWVSLALQMSPQAYEFRISDNGVGMPAEQQHVIELMCRSIASRIPGTGVGLSVVRLLVEQSGGTLAVDSEIDQGSAFIAVLPRFDMDDYLDYLPIG